MMIELAGLSRVKPIVWVGRSKVDLRAFPEDVKDRVGFALFVAQQGKKHPDAKPLRGFGGSGVLEIVVDNDGDTYRAVYTVKFVGRVYVLHIFQKKSKSGVATPRGEITLIRSRLARADAEHRAWSQWRKVGEHG